MPITIDTSAVLAVLLNESTKAAVIDATEGEQLVAPVSLDFEIANAFSRMFKRGLLAVNQAEPALTDFGSISIQRERVPIHRAVILAAKLNLYAYDAFMICVSEQYDCPLLTLDGGLAQAARRFNITVIEI